MVKVNDLVKAGLFTAFIIIAGFIKIPLYPVPVSLVFFAVNLTVLVLERRISVLSVTVYIIIGLIGVPVFSQGGGIGYVFNLSFGYILGFLLTAVICDTFKKLSFFEDRLFIKNLILGGINIFVVYLSGAIYAYILSIVYFGKQIEMRYLFVYYILIFIPGDIMWAVLSAYLTKRLKFVK